MSDRLLLGSGDDAAIVKVDGAEAVSVDALVDGVHFDRAHAAPAEIGRKALAAALSDLAAMGASPGEAYVALGLPADFDDAACLQLADGLAALAAVHRVAIAGGDITRSPVLFLSLTVVGHAHSEEALVSRSGAAAGDVVCVTGSLGGAAAGLRALERPELVRGLDPALARDLRCRQLEPEPRLAAGRTLASSGATALVDLSDGLGADAGHVADASGVRIRIGLGRVPLAAGVAELAAAAELDPLDLVIDGGEDYELLATLPVERVDAAREAVEGTGVALSEVGFVEEGAGVVLTDPAGRERPPRGFDQLAARRGPAGRS